MTPRNRPWNARDRQRFAQVLAETGNPAFAAATIGQSLAAAYAMRDRWPDFADDWRRALAVAWEQVEMRMLSKLLDGEAAAIDPKLALEMLRAACRPPCSRAPIWR